VTRYIISFADGAMTFPDEDLPAVSAAAHAVVQEAKDAGVYVLAGGVTDHTEGAVVAVDGTITSGSLSQIDQHLGGFTIVDVPTGDDALRWAAKIAVACRCEQEVREIMDDPQI
jgi:hypothetical protein